MAGGSGGRLASLAVTSQRVSALLGFTGPADQLYRDWLADDPEWGFGWIGWASGYMPPSGKGILTDYQRAEQLLRQGYAVQGVRDRDAIADWLRLARDKPEHPERS